MTEKIHSVTVQENYCMCDLISFSQEAIAANCTFIFMRFYNNWKHGFNLVESDVLYFQFFGGGKGSFIKFDIIKNFI